MTQTEQEEFIRAFINSVTEAILANAHRFPTSWDGFELRWYVCEKFIAEAEHSRHIDRVNTGLSGYSRRKTNRFKKFENEVLVCNL